MASWSEEPHRVVVEVEGVSAPCGCFHCLAFDLGAGNLIRETHVGIGESQLGAVNDALRQAYEKHSGAELAVKCWREVPKARELASA